MSIFRNVTVPNNQTVLYQLSIREPGSGGAEFATYTFPLSPSSLRSDTSALSTYMDTQGPVSALGVTRVVDRYGQAPAIITIEGTTGWDAHITDGFNLSGLQSIQALISFLANYAVLNQQQIESGVADLYSLEFYDYFLGQFLRIEPIGPQILRQGIDRPQLVYYRLHWAVVGPIGGVGDDNSDNQDGSDSIDTALSTPQSQVATGQSATEINAIFSAYTPTGTINT